MNWPFSKAVERRASYTDAVVEALLARNSGTPAQPSKLAAVEIAAGWTGRALSMAELSPASVLTEAVNAQVLSNIGRRLIFPGEAVYVLTVAGGRVRLTEASHWDVIGTEAERGAWSYRCDIPSPGASVQRTYPAETVLHFQYACDPSQPWRGIGPLSAASETARTAANTENALGDEAATSRGYVVPVPQQDEPDPDDANAVDPLAKLTARLKSLAGKLSLVETTSAGFGGGKLDAPGGGAPSADWTAKRIGASPPAALVELRDKSHNQILAACGFPNALIEAAAGTAGREAYRQWLHTAIRPLGRIVAVELSRVFEVAVSLDFAELRASDDAPIARAIGSRASALKTLVDAGVSLTEARRITGLEGV